MFIICNEKEYDKKKLKGVSKIFISDMLRKVRENDEITHLTHLIPSYKLMSNYYNDKYSKKKYNKKYIEFLEQDEVYATLLVLLMMYEKEKNIAMVCDSDEMDFLYMEFLMKYLKEEFGTKYIFYEKWKEKCSKKNPIDKDKLKKKIKKYKSLIFGEEDEKPKKKKKNKEKIDIEFPDDEPKEMIRRIKVRRIKEGE